MESPSTDDRNAKKTSPRARGSSKILRLRNEVALTVVALSLSGAMVVVPRPTYPQILPLPSVDASRASSREREEILLAISVRDGSLDKETRAIGELFRRVGRPPENESRIAGQSLDSLRREVARLRHREASEGILSGTDALLRLRALQGQLFLDAVRHWLDTGKPSSDLQELGGPFVRIASESWLRDGELVLGEDELRLFFRVHWGKVTGLHGAHPFGPSLEEQRRYYASNLEHPAGAPTDLMTRTANQLGFVRALGKVDSDYPVLLSEGILQLRLGQPESAQRSLRAHLDRHPDGPWTHLARNHLILAARQTDAIAQAGP